MPLIQVVGGTACDHVRIRIGVDAHRKNRGICADPKGPKYLRSTKAGLL